MRHNSTTCDNRHCWTIHISHLQSMYNSYR
nr:MAG TPA: hypothetical protein [Caudoviricetes sp.]